MTTAIADRRPTRRLTATARPYPPPTPPRLREALALLAGERAPGAEYRPEDQPIIVAWTETQARCAEAGDVIARLDAFLAAHLEALRDLALRARHGAGPTALLDEIERTLLTQVQPMAAR